MVQLLQGALHIIQKQKEEIKRYFLLKPHLQTRDDFLRCYN